jgi:dihydrofolate reductase
MRKVTLGLANSLDNYIARQDGGADWLQWDQEIAEISSAFMKTVDAILIGRKTYEVILNSGQTSYPGAVNYVFTRSQRRAARFEKAIVEQGGGVQVISDDAARFVARLKKRKGKGIVVFGGGALAQSLFEHDLIDEVVLNVHPILLGSGIPLFHELPHQIDLRLISCRPLKTGSVILSYRVKH